MTRELKVVSTKSLSKLLKKSHDEILTMLACIVVKHPRSTSEFILKQVGGDFEVKITADGLALIIDFLMKTEGIEMLIELMSEMKKGE